MEETSSSSESRESDTDTFFSASAVSMNCEILQSIRLRQNSMSTSTTSLASSSVVGSKKKELEMKLKKLCRAERTFQKQVKIHKEWRVELEAEEELFNQRVAEKEVAKGDLLTKIDLNDNKIACLEEEAAMLEKEIAEKEKYLEDLETQIKEVAVVRAVFAEVQTVADRLTGLNVGTDWKTDNDGSSDHTYETKPGRI